MLSSLLPIFYKALVIYLSVGLILVLSERKLVYLPNLVDTPDFGECEALVDTEALEYEGVRFYHKRVDDTRVAVLYHGNAGSVCERAAFADSFERAGYSYILVEYPGYAGGDVTPSKKRILEETHRVQTFIEAQEYEDVALIGESLGNGPAAYHATHATPQKMVMVSPYNKLADGAGWIGWFYPLELLMRENYTPGVWLENVDTPTYLIRAERDEIFPRESTTELRGHAAGETELVEIEGITHNDLYLHPKLYITLETFLNKKPSTMY